MVCYASLTNLVSSQLCPFSNSNCFGQSQAARTRVKHDSNLWVFEGRGWGDWLDAGKSPTWSNAESAPLEPSSPSSPPTTPTLEPPPSRPNLERQDFLVARCRNLYKRKAKECQSPSLREEKNGGPKTQRTRPSKLCESQIFTLYSISEKCSPLKKIPPLKNILPSPIRYSPVENNHPWKIFNPEK